MTWETTSTDYPSFGAFEPMNILFAASEAVPFSKTGGLADVCGALPGKMAALGHNSTLIIPAHTSSWSCDAKIEPMGIDLTIPIGSKSVTGQLLQSKLPGTDVPVYLIAQDNYFDRESLYMGANGREYPDNCERFTFFSRAVLETIRLLGLDVDILHCNDWQTGLIPAYLAAEYRSIPCYESIASIFTIHNLAYQGRFWHWDMLLTGLDWKYFNWEQMEFHGDLNLLKTGIVFADSITTVSPRYAQEIQHAELGCGLEGTLQQRSESLTGILNGIDTTVWNPSTDPHIIQNYDIDTVIEGKAACKADLQRRVGLPENPDVPLIGLIGRLCEQKGIELVIQILEDRLPRHEAQWVFLGTGETHLENHLRRLAAQYPERLAAKLEFSGPLSHQIEAGSDMFLMPSKYEPCGLNQIYSLAYGTLPVVRSTGGLADTVVGAIEQTVADGTANGFSFWDYSAYALSDALNWACLTYYDNRPLFDRMIKTGMSQDWSWKRRASEYIDLYKNTLDHVRGVRS
jgi:starch synthase